MTACRDALGWAAAIAGVALAAVFEVIDQVSATTLLIALPVAGWMTVRGRRCRIAARRG